MRILVAPDSFKGSITANEAAIAIKKGIHNVDPRTKVDIVPMADGGEGTMSNLVNNLKGEKCYVKVKDPLNRDIISSYGVIDKSAVIELASASGMSKITEKELNPIATSTYGSGQLILDALNQGLRSFIICLGGSATNDAGSGLLQALGFRFLDKEGLELNSGGLALKKLHKIDCTRVDPRLEHSKFLLICDVNSPLVGPLGASINYGPQKGASQKVAQQLDIALINFANIVEEQQGISLHQFPGSGAGGGVAGGMFALLNSELKSGINFMIDTLNVEELLTQKKFSFIITGEGKIDSQTDSGKVVSGISRLGNKYKIPTIAIAGSVKGDFSSLHNNGLVACFSITNEPMKLDLAMKNADILLEKQTEQILRLLIANINNSLKINTL